MASWRAQKGPARRLPAGLKIGLRREMQWRLLSQLACRRAIPSPTCRPRAFWW